ncbi:hypothetical protein L218DRAFT_950040 [Marasmius fiardii PR-910]|nr:hypothetical protein L218DRAFT_950040 [Marasmius fiardii PR-910]
MDSFGVALLEITTDGQTKSMNFLVEGRTDMLFGYQSSHGIPGVLVALYSVHASGHPFPTSGSNSCKRKALHSHSNLKAVENVWAPPDHEDFELVLNGFAILIVHGNVWAVDLLEHLEQLPTLKDFQLDDYNQEEEEDYLTNNQDRKMIVCLGSELENLQPLLVDQDDEYYMSGCKWRPWS